MPSGNVVVTLLFSNFLSNDLLLSNQTLSVSHIRSYCGSVLEKDIFKDCKILHKITHNSIHKGSCKMLNKFNNDLSMRYQQKIEATLYSSFEEVKKVTLRSDVVIHCK